MMYQWLVFTLICLACLVVGAIVGILIDRWLREGEQLDVEIERYEKHGRHAKTQPRTQLVAAPRPRTVMPWYTPAPEVDKPQAGRLTDTGEMRAITTRAGEFRDWMTADNAAWLDKWSAV